MNNDSPHVRPGEVISSSLFNQILDRLAALEAAVAEGGGGNTGGGAGPLTLTGFQSAAGNAISEIAVGQVLAILGANFPFPATGQTVSLDGNFVPANAFRTTSNSRRLELVVPEIGQLPPSGRNLFVRVHRGTASAPRLLRFLPAQGPPAPQIQSIHPAGAAPGTPVVIGGTLVVEGTGFADDPAENQVVLTPQISSTDDTYEAQINAAASSASAVHFTVPDMSEIESGDGAQLVRVDLLAPGVPDPATAEQLVIRF